MSFAPFENLPNFRDVAGSINVVCKQRTLKTGLFFRSGLPDETTRVDRQRLLNEYGVRTIIDLRTTTEHINAAKKRSESVTLAQSALAPVPDDLITESIKIPGINYAEINLNGKGFERSLIWQLSYISLAKVIGLMAFGYRMNAINIIAREVLQPRGLIGLGIDTVEHSGPEIKEVFDVLSEEDSWPVMVHCTQGKDRTGLIVVLVLLLCGIDVDAITSDYIKSEAEVETRKDEVSSIGLDESFSKCPNDFPKKIAKHIQERYGSTGEYLQGLGVKEEKLVRIRSILLTYDETP